MKLVIFLVLSMGILSCVTTARFTKEQSVIVDASSGFKMDEYVVTANHVAKNDFVIVKDIKGNEELGLVVARDQKNDIALIRVKEPVYVDYSTATVRVRQPVYSVGNPIGLNYSEISGEVQNVSRDDNGTELIQIGIDVCFGSSGSPVYNAQGELVGVISRAVPGTRFTLIVPIQKVVLLIKKQK